MAFRNRIVRLSQLQADQIIGALIATAATGKRWVMDSTLANEIRGYTGRANEHEPALLRVNTSAAQGGFLEIRSPNMFDGAGPAESGYVSITMRADPDDPNARQFVVSADLLSLVAGAFFTSVDGAGWLFGGGGGTPLQQMEFGTFSANTNASGQLVIPHGLAGVPSYADFTVTTAGSANRVGNAVVGAGSVTFGFRDGATNAVTAAGVAITGRYLFIR